MTLRHEVNLFLVSSFNPAENGYFVNGDAFMALGDLGSAQIQGDKRDRSRAELFFSSKRDQEMCMQKAKLFGNDVRKTRLE